MAAACLAPGGPAQAQTAEEYRQQLEDAWRDAQRGLLPSRTGVVVLGGLDSERSSNTFRIYDGARDGLTAVVKICKGPTPGDVDIDTVHEGGIVAGEVAGISAGDAGCVVVTGQSVDVRADASGTPIEFEILEIHHGP